jgi:hypothetical protein
MTTTAGRDRHPVGGRARQRASRSSSAHGTDALVGALRRAVAFRRFRAADVRSILAAGAGTPDPRPAGDALILDLPVAPTRSLDAYKVTPAADGGVTS